VSIHVLPGETVDVFVSYRERSIPCQAKVKSVGSTEVAFTRPSRHRVIPPLSKGEVRLLVKRRDGACKATSVIERCDSTRLVLRYPFELQEVNVQRRSHVRVRIPLNVEVLIHQETGWIPAMLEDISGGGASIVLHQDIVPSCNILLRMKLPDCDSSTIGAEVVRVRPFIDRSSIIYRVGVMFSDIISNLQAMLVRFVNMRLLTQKNTRFYAFDHDYDDHWSDVHFRSSIIGVDSRSEWRIFNQDVLALADRARLNGSRFGLICSSSLHPRVLQALGKRSSLPLLLTADEYIPSMDEVSRVEIFRST